MKLFKPFDLIVLAYCLATDLMGIMFIGFPAFKIMMNLAVIIVAHKISWRSLIFIFMIDIPIIAAIQFQKLIFSMAVMQSLQADLLFSFGYFLFTLFMAVPLAAIGVKLLNKFVPERLKMML